MKGFLDETEKSKKKAELKAHHMIEEDDLGNDEKLQDDKDVVVKEEMKRSKEIQDAEEELKSCKFEVETAKENEKQLNK